MEAERKLTVEYIKSLGKERSDDNLKLLIELFYKDVDIEIKREIVSSIGRQHDLNRIFEFLLKEGFNQHYMDVVYQMFRTILYKSREDHRFEELKSRFLKYYNNEVLDKMNKYYEYKFMKKVNQEIHGISEPMILEGNNQETLRTLPMQSVQLIFTSPPYYNAREYSDYHSYAEYLDNMYKTLLECNRVLEDGRFIIYNVSPVISKRPGREFESIRYPIHYDFHNILTKAGFNFIDEIIWVKPEASVPNRNGGYMQTKNPLAYKPNNITESIMVYRKEASFLLDKNISKYDRSMIYPMPGDNFDTSNVWYISPKSSKDHPAIFPEELCKKILTYYSFKGDVVLDPFAGSGTFGKVAIDYERIPVLCESNKEYVKVIKKMIMKTDKHI